MPVKLRMFIDQEKHISVPLKNEHKNKAIYNGKKS